MGIINLKNISFGDSDNIKLDKVNYNFDQLVSNGGGPQGHIGTDGEKGPQGVNGYQGPFGYQGPIGVQGPQGPSGADVWFLLESNVGSLGNLSSDVIFPKHTYIDPLIDFPEPPVVSIGFKSTDPEYNTYAEYADFLTAPYQFIINRSINRSSNLVFKTYGSTNLFQHKISLSEDALSSTMVMGFTETSDSRLELWATEHRYVDSLTGESLVSIYGSVAGRNIASEVPAYFNNGLTINGDLIIGTSITPGDVGSPDTNKIATALDNSGTIIFKSLYELGGTAPAGTIISLLPSIFNDTNLFVRNEIVDITPDSPIEIRVGAGKGLYAGWYLCNGKTWTNGSTIEYTVPDLTSFSYSIDDDATSLDPASQGSIDVINNDTIIIGGADVDMVADFDTTQYSITSSLYSDTLLMDDSGTGEPIDFIIKRLPQIIYLVDTDLYWQDAGSNQVPITEVNYVFDEISGVPPTTNILDYTFPRQATLGSSADFDILLPKPIGYEYISVPDFTGVPIGYSINSAVVENGNIRLTLHVDSQQAEGTTITIEYDFTGNVKLPANVVYDFKDLNLAVEDDVFQYIHSAAPGVASQFTIELQPPIYKKFIGIPIFSAPLTFEVDNEILNEDGSITLTLIIDAQPADGTELTITYDSTFVIEQIEGHLVSFIFKGKTDDLEVSSIADHIVEHTAVPGPASIFDTIINPPAGYEFIRVPDFFGIPVGYDVLATSIVNGNLELTLVINSHPDVPVNSVTIEYDYTGDVVILDNVVVNYVFRETSQTPPIDDIVISVNATPGIPIDVNATINPPENRLYSTSPSFVVPNTPPGITIIKNDQLGGKIELTLRANPHPVTASTIIINYNYSDNIRYIIEPENTVNYKFIGSTTSQEDQYVDNYTKIWTAPANSPTSFLGVITPPVGFKFTDIPVFEVPIGYTITNSYISYTGDVVFIFNIDLQPSVSNTEIIINYDYTGMIATVFVTPSTIRYIFNEVSNLPIIVEDIDLIRSDIVGLPSEFTMTIAPPPGYKYKTLSDTDIPGMFDAPYSAFGSIFTITTLRSVGGSLTFKVVVDEQPPGGAEITITYRNNTYLVLNDNITISYFPSESGSYPYSFNETGRNVSAPKGSFQRIGMSISTTSSSNHITNIPLLTILNRNGGNIPGASIENAAIQNGVIVFELVIPNHGELYGGTINAIDVKYDANAINTIYVP